MEPIVLDAAGHRRSPVTMPNYHRGRPPRNKGCRYPADPPTVDEIVAVMRSAGNGSDAARLRALIVILWRAGLRVSEALDLSETDLDRASGGILVRRGKGGKRREVGMDRWVLGTTRALLSVRASLPVGAAFWVLAVLAVAMLSRWVRRPAAPRCAPGGCPTTFAPHSPKAFCSRSSSASSVTLISGSPRFTCAGSRTPRSSTLFTNDWPDAQPVNAARGTV